MVFSSLEFLTIFLPVTILCYFILPGKLKNSVLLFFSLLFYAWGEPLYVLIMIFSIVINYLFGIGIDRAKENIKAKKGVLALGVIFDLALLGVFKYSGFFIENIDHLLGIAIPVPELVMPIGISFFTFQAMSYVIDVYRKKAEVQKNLLNFGLYISLFPQLIAGPIVRYATVADEINHRAVNFDLAANGIKRFIIGFAKKILLANNVGLLWSQISSAKTPAAASAWLGAVAYAFQLYFDFSGYSDMAIGLGKIFGFNFSENFNYPYISKSITEFWNRWHISLSTWFKEYVYIPLGGNRQGVAKQIRNILIVWLLTGFWHGADWNFILWGLYYGICLLLEKFVLHKILQKLPSFIRHLYTLTIILIGWVIFAFDDTAMLFAYFGSMFGANGLIDRSFPYAVTTNGIFLVILIFAATPLPSKLGNYIRRKFSAKPKAVTAMEIVWFLLLALLSVAYLVDSTYNPFIYFRF